MITSLASLRRASIALVSIAFAIVAPVRAADDPAALEEALARDPENAANHQKLGDALLDAGQGERAGKVFRRLLDLDPKSCAAHLGLARAHLAQNLADHAVRAAEEARRLCPENADVAFVLGTAYNAGHDPISAIESWRHAIDLDPSRLRTYGLLAAACEARSLFPEAISTCEALLLRPGLGEDSPEFREAVVRLVRVALASGAFRLASVWTDRAFDAPLTADELTPLAEGFAKDPTCRPRTRLLLGRAWERVGDIESARASYGDALKCADDLVSVDARAALARLAAPPAKTP